MMDFLRWLYAFSPTIASGLSAAVMAYATAGCYVPRWCFGIVAALTALVAVIHVQGGPARMQARLNAAKPPRPNILDA